MMTTLPSIRAYVHALPGGRFRRVTEYVRDHPDQDLTLAQLSALVHMSPYHFSRLFRHSTGLPPHRFVVRARIERAARLLETSDLPIGHIGRLVGFPSPSHFSTVFRRLTNVTPRGHRGRYLRSAGPNAEGANNERDRRDAPDDGRRRQVTGPSRPTLPAQSTGNLPEPAGAGGVESVLVVGRRSGAFPG